MQVACVIGIATYFWIVDFPEKAHHSFYFCTEAEANIAVRRIQKDRGDGEPTPFRWKEIARHFLDPKIYGFAATFFLLVRIAVPSNWMLLKFRLEPGLDGVVVLPTNYVRLLLRFEHTTGLTRRVL